MKVIKTEEKLCLSCMEHHKVQTIILKETEEFKGQEVSFDATYEFCSIADEFLESEEMLKANGLAMNDAYRDQCSKTTY